MFGLILSRLGLKKQKSINVEDINSSTVLIVDSLNINSKEDLDSLMIITKKTKKELDKNYYKDFIGEINLEQNLIDRKFFNLDDLNIKESGYFFNEKANDLDILSLFQLNSKIVVLGNPGLGKTTELERLSISLWNNDENEYIPVYRNLRNFTVQDTLSSYLAIDWKFLSKVIFIFDGIDEIQNIQDFTSKLETFISNLDANRTDYKFLVSCRTNVYESIVKSIKDFSLYYLRELTIQEGLNLLKQKCNFKIDDSNVDNNYQDFLKNPFLIDIVATYIDTNKKMPNSTADLWESYIDKRLTVDVENKLAKSTLNPSLIKTYSKQLSLINELMKTNISNEDDIFKVVKHNNSDFAEFKKNPLMDKLKGKPIWFFEHRNIQEYFAALIISHKEFKDILEFIQIGNTNKTHPSLFNTITFLINLLNKETKSYNHLVDWLIANEPELLFRADFERISSDVKEKVFQKYFQMECIEKTLWINTNKAYEIDKIARFSDCTKNFYYLKTIWVTNSYHFRIRYSALEILALFSIPDGEIISLKKELLNQINNSNEPMIKAQMVRLIHCKRDLKNDEEFIDEVFETFKLETNKEINSSLLSLINDFENIDKFSDYIKEEFLRAHNLKKREEEDEVGRGNEYTSQALILRLESSKHFLEVIKYYFIGDANLHYNENFAKQILERCVYFSNQDKNFVKNLISEIKENYRFHVHQRLLKRIVIDSNSTTEILFFLLEYEEFKNVIFLVSEFVDFSNVEEVVKLTLDKQIDPKYIESFRNLIGNHNHNNRKIAEKFDHLMREKGVKFKEEVYTDEKREADTIKHLDNIQNQLNVLFDKTKLKKEIASIFKKHNGKLTWEDASRLESKWYEENGNSAILINSSLDIINSIMPSLNYTLSFDDAVKGIEEEAVLFFEVKKLIEQYKSSQWDYILSDEHKEIIRQWCIKTSNDVDFNNVIKLRNRGTFSLQNNNYKKIELIFYFQDLLEFKLDKGFLLNCIEFHDFDKTNQIDENFERLKTKINDVKSFNNRIIENILNKELFAFSLSKHIEYALNNNLTITFPKIREYFKEKDSVFNESKKLEKYIEITGDESLLLECCSNPKSLLFWSSIKIMMKLGVNRDFCLEKSIENLNTQHEVFNIYALENLFNLNHIRAIEFLVESAEKKNFQSIRMIQYSNYDAFKDYEIIKKLFNLIYRKEIDRFEYNDYSSFFKTYVSNLSVEEKHYNEIRKILEKIKVQLKEYGSDLFYINLLIDDVTDSFINSQSTTFSFDEAFKRMNELIN